MFNTPEYKREGLVIEKREAKVMNSFNEGILKTLIRCWKIESKCKGKVKVTIDITDKQFVIVGSLKNINKMKRYEKIYQSFFNEMMSTKGYTFCYIATEK
jgi:hypothetical protein